MSKELRPCPFCGEKVTLDYRVMPNRKHWFITCDCCGMMYQDALSQRKYVNPNTEAEFCKVDAEISEYLSEYKACIDQLTAHDATERQNDKSSNDTQTDTFVYGKESEE